MDMLEIHYVFVFTSTSGTLVPRSFDLHEEHKGTVDGSFGIASVFLADASVFPAISRRGDGREMERIAWWSGISE